MGLGVGLPLTEGHCSSEQLPERAKAHASLASLVRLGEFHDDHSVRRFGDVRAHLRRRAEGESLF
ncbi:hypothetical protein [Cellulomonas sp. NTE-D12]|uniref:hypothetical protein n=1 Tax=Cellulomonas sp. NTE-D12 TaxID=2962632 RepID=UPI0030817973|nr:hypothetical protein CELD12_11250 [Cellulomonas sp. NTE-D12]